MNYSVRFIAIIASIAFVGLTGQGCGSSRKDKVVDPRSGQLTKALNITFRPTYRSGPVAEGTQIQVGDGTIAALTSDVELYSLTVYSDHPVNQVQLFMTVGSPHLKVGESPKGMSQVHTIKTDNLGYLYYFMGDGENTNFSLYADTTGLDGELVTFELISAEVKIAGSEMQNLGIINRSNSVLVKEPAKIDLIKLATNTAFTSVGTDDVWLNFEIKNVSTKNSCKFFYISLRTSSANVDIQLADTTNKVLATLRSDGYGYHYATIQIDSSNYNDLNLAPGQTKQFRLLGNPNGEQAIQIMDMWATAATDSDLQGGDSIIANQIITYP